MDKWKFYLIFLRSCRNRPRIFYITLALCLCSVMCLGFIVARHPGEGYPGYYLRASLAYPGISGESMEFRVFSRLPDLPEKKEGWHTRGELSGKGAREGSGFSVSFSGADAALEGWAASGGLLGMNRGEVVLRGALVGDQPLPRMGALVLQSESSPLPLRDFTGIAEGRHSPEDLLAELDGSFFTPPVYGASSGQGGPNWESGFYGADVFSARARPAGELLLCFGDRMETASWLNLLRLDLPGKRFSEKAGGGKSPERPSRYLGHVEFFAGRYALPPSLVYGIMRTESSFNPAAVSPANALGLMQVVPESAGGEVHAYLTGKKGSPEENTLFKPASNIQYGTAYLHLLRKRHFKDVKNPVSRELCVIAAYNCGPSSLFRIFDGDRSRALEKINRLTPEELYPLLLKKLPSRETREYLPRVLAARNEFLRGTAKF